MKVSYLIIFLIGLFVIFFSATSYAGEKGVWQLVDIRSGTPKQYKDNCSEEKIQSSNGSFKFEKHYFKGRCNNNNDTVFSATATWPQPPSKLYPGESISLTASVVKGGNITGLSLHCGIDISTDSKNCDCGGKCGGKSIGVASVHSNGMSTNSIDKVFKVPDGAKGGVFALRYCPTSSAYYGQPGFRYIYQWMQQESATGFPPETRQETKQPFPPKLLPKTKAKSGLDKKRKDSGAGFSDISGQVMICPHDENPEDEDNWDMVDLKTKIHVFDHIRTGQGSSAIIGFSDMSTFEMGPETEIMISTPPEQESKLSLVWGNIKMNFKKMLKDGSMDIEMNQAVLGIKGTRFECWERGATSQVAVYEGVVEVVSKSTGQTIDLNTGQEVIAATSGLFLPIGQDTKVKAIRKEAIKVFDNTNRNQAYNTPPRQGKAGVPKPNPTDQTEKRHQPGQSAPQDTSQSNPLAGKWLDPGSKGFWTFTPLPGGGYKAAYKGNIETQGQARLQGRKLEIEFSVGDIEIRYQLTLSRDGAQARGSWRSSDGESEEVILTRTESGTPSQPGAVGNIRPGEKPRILFENGNSGGVRNSPQAPTVITLISPQLITRITTYHHNHAKGDDPGTLGLQDNQGRTYGPWRTLSQNPNGTPARKYWTVAPMVVIPAGKYQVVDSNPDTWSHNATSGSRGITWVEGVPR